MTWQMVWALARARVFIHTFLLKKSSNNRTQHAVKVLRRTNIQVENSAMNFLDAYNSITIQSEAYRDLFFNEWMFELSEHADDR